jgi:integrase
VREVRTFCATLAYTGCRISEALALTPTDVDLQRAVLTVRETKFRKSRLVPVHPTTVAALTRYAEARRQRVSDPRIETFLISDRGTPLDDRTVHDTFAKIRAQLGWIGRGGYAWPRIHDLRHSWICHTLVRAYQQQQSVDHVIDVVSTYVGHASVSDTYWYLTGTPVLLELAGSAASCASAPAWRAGRATRSPWASAVSPPSSSRSC